MHPLAVRSCLIHLSMHPGSLNTFFPNLRQPPEERRKEEALEVKLRHDVSRQLQSADLALGGADLGRESRERGRGELKRWSRSVGRSVGRSVVGPSGVLPQKVSETFGGKRLVGSIEKDMTGLE